MEFIEQIAQAVKKYAPEYGVKVCSPIIAQAVLESANGTSELATNANNFFGLKYRPNRCPSSSGIYNKIGSEQDADGSYRSFDMCWFQFDSIDACVKGYFDFTNIANYTELKEELDPVIYLQKIKDAGYATCLDYVEKCTNVMERYELTQYDVYDIVAMVEDEMNVEETKEVKKLYRVQVGAFGVKQNAENMLKKIIEAGFDGFIAEEIL